MENVLNRGLNFAILPQSIDITQILVDFKRYERSVIWMEYWYGRDQENEPKQPIFKKQKYNLPKNHKVPDDLKTFLEGAKSDLLDPQNRTKVNCNLPLGEIRALKDLIQLQKERKITIKQCDKGAGIMILNFDEYLQTCYLHLMSKQIQQDGTEKPYYMKVNENTFEKAKDML